MIAVDQTRFGKDRPNCLAACLASIFEVPIETIDSPALAGDGTQFQALVDVCARHGYRPFSYAPGGAFPPIAPPGYHIACSESHATVALDGVIVHDPHPRRAALPAITEWILLIPVAYPDRPVVSATLDELGRTTMVLTMAIEQGMIPEAE